MTVAASLPATTDAQPPSSPPSPSLPPSSSGYDQRVLTLAGNFAQKVDQFEALGQWTTKGDLVRSEHQDCIARRRLRASLRYSAIGVVRCSIKMDFWCPLALGSPFLFGPTNGNPR